ncbi:MAG TPA: hypothetical protein DCS90_15660, partial [Ktedonobacter sp.]|nr:hypothetical protein [Ktedonobacter sp.]
MLYYCDGNFSSFCREDNYMQCPRCGHENANSSTFCEQCSSPLSVTEVTPEQAEYKAPPPSLLNGHKKLSLAPPSP